MTKERVPDAAYTSIFIRVSSKHKTNLPISTFIFATHNISITTETNLSNDVLHKN